MMTNLKKDVSRSGQRYAELLCDFMFKRLFGSEANKDVLIGFLNMLLDDVVIEHVDFIPTEHLGLTEEDRKVIFDIACQCKDGRSFIIEMQKGYQKHFRERALYYTTYPINGQGRAAQEEFVRQKAEGGDEGKFRWDYDLKPVIVVAILNFKFEHEDGWPAERYHSSYRLREDSTQEVMTDALRFVFLELGRFRKRLWELESVFDKWMYLLKHIHEMEEIPEKFADPLFRRLFLLSEIGNFTAEEYQHYQKSLTNMGDYDNIINTAVEEAEKRGMSAGLEQGRIEGEAVGRTKGREEGKVETARNLLALGVDIETISKATGLDAGEIEALREE